MQQIVPYLSQWKLFLDAHQTLGYLTGSVAILLLFLILRLLVNRYLFPWISHKISQTDSNADDEIGAAFEKPVSLLFLAIGIYVALWYLPLSPAVDALVLKLLRSSVILLIGWGVYNFAAAESILSHELQEKVKVDRILIPFFSKFIRFVVVALIVVMVANEWGYDINGFIAGLGLGGLAFALAAKDALANIFGGLVIIMEKPFSIGEWIYTPSVEGTVETITFRSTRIRGFDQAIITVPNSTLANEPITNYTRMGKRRINYHLGLTYSTSREQISNCVQRIKQMLIDHPDIHPETVIVNFEAFGDSSLDILIYCFTNTTQWTEYLEVRQAVNLEIMKILEDMNVIIAFPSRSLYFETPLLSQDIDSAG